MEVNNESENEEGEETHVRNQARGTYKKHSAETVALALNSIKNEHMSIYAAAKKYSVPCSTLFCRLKNENPKKKGRSQVLSPAVEKDLAAWLIKCASMGDPRTREQLVAAAADLGKLSDENEEKFKSVTPSPSWIKRFMSRNPEVSFRVPSTVSRASANVSATDIVNYIVGIRNYLEKIGKLHLLDDPTAWGNSDETGIDLNPVPRTVLAAKGGKNVYRVETANPKERISVMYTFLASGEMLTPQLILKDSTSTIADVAFSCGGEDNLKQ